MNARDYWAQRPVKPKFADPSVPYRQAIAKEVAAFAPKTVLEFGCGPGANLAAIANASPAIEQLYGIDINREAIVVGRKAFPSLYLIEGDHKAIDEHVDLALTVSAIDHIENPAPVLYELAKHAEVIILVEPWTGREGLIAENPDGTAATPFTYSWDYVSFFRDMGRKVSIRKMPLREGGVGPLYRRYTVR